MIDRLFGSRLFRFAATAVAGAAILAACSQMPQAPRESAAASVMPSAAAPAETSKNAKSLRSIMPTGVPPLRPNALKPAAARAMRAWISG